MINRNQTLFEFLTKEAIKREISLSQMAKEIGIHHSTLLGTEFRKPQMMTLVKIVRYLELEDDFFEINKLPIKKDDH